MTTLKQVFVNISARFLWKVQYGYQLTLKKFLQSTMILVW